MLKIATTAALAAIMLGGCSGEPIVADIGQDKVQVQSNGATMEQINAKAAESCAMYKRVAKSMGSYRCADGYCIQKIYLYACMPPEG